MRRLLDPCRNNEMIEFLVRVQGCWREGRFLERLLRTQAWLNCVTVPACVCFTFSVSLLVLEEKAREENSVSESHFLFHFFLEKKSHVHFQNQLFGVFSQVWFPPHPFLSHPLRQI